MNVIITNYIGAAHGIGSWSRSGSGLWPWSLSYNKSFRGSFCRSKHKVTIISRTSSKYFSFSHSKSESGSKTKFTPWYEGISKHWFVN